MIVLGLYFLHESVFRNVSTRDEGAYECQISTQSKMSHFVYLKVLGKQHTIPKHISLAQRRQNIQKFEITDLRSDPNLSIPQIERNCSRKTLALRL